MRLLIIPLCALVALFQGTDAQIDQDPPDITLYCPTSLFNGRPMGLVSMLASMDERLITDVQLIWSRIDSDGREDIWIKCAGEKCENKHLERVAKTAMTRQGTEGMVVWRGEVTFLSATKEMSGTWLAKWLVLGQTYAYKCKVSIVDNVAEKPPTPILLKTSTSMTSANLTFEVADNLAELSKMLAKFGVIQFFLLEIFMNKKPVINANVGKEATFETSPGGKALIRYSVLGLEPSTVYSATLTAVGYSVNSTTGIQFETIDDVADNLKAPYIYSRHSNIVSFEDEVKLYCITSERRIKFKWIYNGLQLVGEDGSLLERKAGQDRSGEYRCSIISSTQFDTSDTYKLIVAKPSDVVTKTSTGQITLKITYTPDLADRLSPKFHAMSTYINELISVAMRRRPSYAGSGILGFRNGSIITDMLLYERVLATNDQPSSIIKFMSEQLSNPNTEINSLAVKHAGMTVKYDNLDRVIFEGVPLEMVCQYEAVHNGPTGLEVVWTLNNSIINQETSTTFTFSTSKESQTWSDVLSLQTTRYNYTLRIEEFHIRLAGDYTCGVKHVAEDPFQAGRIPVPQRATLYYWSVVRKPVVKISPLSALLRDPEQRLMLNCTHDFAAIIYIIDEKDNRMIMRRATRDKTTSFNILVPSDVNFLRCLAWSSSNIQTTSDVCRITRVDSTTVMCKQSVDDQGNDWQETPGGTTSTQLFCPKGYSGYVVRVCHKNGTWDRSNYVRCSKTKLDTIQEEIQSINKDGVRATQKQITDISKSVNSSVSGTEPVYSGDIVKVVDILNEVGKAAVSDANKDVNLVDSNALENFASATDTILATKDSTWQEISDDTAGTERNLDIGSKLVVAMEKIAVSSLNEAKYSSEPIVKKNVAIKRDRISQDDIVFPIVKEKNYKRFNEWVVKSKNKLFLSANNFGDDPGKDQVLYAIVLYNAVDSKFVVNSKEQDRYGDGRQFKDKAVASDIMSFSLSKKFAKFSSPLNLEFEITKVNHSSPVCAYLDTSQGPLAIWNNKGCRTTESKEGVVKCHCDHLTNFAILMSPYKTDGDDKHHEILSLVTYVGCGISIICLIITLVMHAVTWKYVRENRSILHVHLSVVLILAYVFFIGGIERTENDIACTVVTALLHFLFLAVFSIMLVEGIQIFISVTFVFSKDLPLTLMLFLVYFCPMVIVGVTYGLTQNDYRDSDFCWLSMESGTLWAFVGPALGVILVNLIIMCITMKAMLSTVSMRAKDAKAKAKSSIRAICVLSPIFGITWVFGVFSFNDSLVTFQYLFAIFNTLQGFLVFLFYCVFSNQIRDGLRHMMRKHRSRSFGTEEQMFSSKKSSGSNSGRINNSFDASYPASDVSSSRRSSNTNFANVMSSSQRSNSDKDVVYNRERKASYPASDVSSSRRSSNINFDDVRSTAQRSSPDKHVIYNRAFHNM